jgi:hypothetical protein
MNIWQFPSKGICGKKLVDIKILLGFHWGKVFNVEDCFLGFIYEVSDSSCPIELLSLIRLFNYFNFHY